MLTPSQALFCMSLFGVVAGGTGYQAGKQVTQQRLTVKSKLAPKPAPKPTHSFDTGRSIINIWSTPSVFIGTAICPDWSSLNAIPSLEQNEPKRFFAADSVNPFFFATRSVTSPIPEPPNWVMAIIGFGLVGVSLRKKNRLIFNDEQEANT